MTIGERVLGLYGLAYRGQQYCDNCANDLPPAYVTGIVHGTAVAVCLGGCLARLLQVWEPGKRRFPLVQTLVSLVFLALLGWH